MEDKYIQAYSELKDIFLKTAYLRKHLSSIKQVGINNGKLEIIIGLTKNPDEISELPEKNQEHIIIDYIEEKRAKLLG